MWDKLTKKNNECGLYRDALEALPLGIEAEAGSAELRAHVAAVVLVHARECESCIEETEIFWLTRNILREGFVADREVLEVTQSSPWLATRVMAKIAEREADTRQLMLEWRGTISRVASKLALVAAGALLVAGTWVYDLSDQRGSTQTAQAGAARVEAGPPYLFDQASGVWSADDALVSPGER